MHRSQIDKPLLPLHKEMVGLFRQLFKKLDEKGYIRRGLSHGDREKLFKIMLMTGDFGQTFNYMWKLFDPQNPNREYLWKKLDQIGLTDHHRAYLWIQTMLSNYLVNVEAIFRFTFLFFLNECFFTERGYKKSDMTVSSLLKALKKLYPPVQNLDKAFDTDLRNSLAHGSFWFENGRWCITSDPHFKKVICLELLEVMMKFKKANIVAMAFTDVLFEEINKGTFRA
ncbi:MAG: hypothetical protein OEZ25_02825 [Candidatus Bathyarchaeota archaeon]|nr:hypothetical protein [Candidatus Bathyarchaeota archaeon]